METSHQQKEPSMSRCSPRLRPVLGLALALAATALMPASSLAKPAKPAKPRPGAAPVVGAHAHHHRGRVHGSAYSPSVNDLSASGSCNWYTHTNGFGASLFLNTNRFPNGAWVSVRYAYRLVNSTTWNYTGWYTPSWINNYLGRTTTFGSDGAPIYGPKSLLTVRFNVTSGQYVGWAQVGVWNGSYYEYTSTSPYDVSYTNWGQYNSSGVSASSCWVSG
jgi:hypothetical protein